MIFSSRITDVKVYFHAFFVCFLSVRFTLDESDDVTWELTAQAEQETLPLFSCRTFEVSFKFVPFMP